MTSMLMLSVGNARAQAPTGTPTPPTEWALDDVVRAAIAQHPMVEAARDRIQAALGTRQTAASLLNPVATYWMENGTFPGQSPSIGLDRETSAYVTLPLEPLFQRPRRVQRADADVKAAEIALNAARRQVALDAAHAFYRVALTQTTVDVTEENRSRLEQLVSYNRSRVAQGATPEVELIRAQVELDRASTDVALAHVDLARSRAELWPFVSAASPKSTFAILRVAVPGTAATTRLPISPLNDLIGRARDRRPDMLAAHARVSAATTETALQRALTVRQVGATFGVKRVEDRNSMIAGISVPVPLFDRNRGEIQRATADLLAAQQELVWIERTVDAAVEGAYETAQRLLAQVGALEPSFLDRAEQANRITVAAYQEGAATLLEVLDSARTLADARVTYFRAVFAQRQSAFDLAMATGDEPEAALTALAQSEEPSRTAQERQR
jgi:cobalt-zinc-cadmium efflux system outer membrane protein